MINPPTSPAVPAGPPVFPLLITAPGFATSKYNPDHGGKENRRSYKSEVRIKFPCCSREMD